MKRLVIGAAAAVGAVVAVAALMVTMWLPGTASASTGPGISVTNVTLLANGAGGCTNAGGCVAFDVVSTGSGFAAYNGDNLEISWDPAVFQFGSAAGTGQFAGALCSVNIGAPPPPPPAPFPQTAGSYLNMGCVALGPTFSTAGTMANVILNIAGTGCSPVHLVTFGAPDGGDSSNGTFTTDAADASVQTNTYADFSTVGTGGIDQTGATGCTLTVPPTATSVPATDTPVPPTATDTPVPGAPTNTPVPPPTNTAVPPTNTPGAGGNTATPVLRTVTPSPTVGTPSANTPVPAATSTTAPGGGPGGVATAPGGGPGGVITGPNTGTGAESGGGFNVVMAALLAAVAMLVVGSGAGYAWWRRAQGR